MLRPPRKSNVRVLLLMDVGGSMDPHADLVSRLFSATKRASNIRELKTYYFHNCVYGRLYATHSFSEPLTVREVLDQVTPEWKLVMVGDAAMHPAELLGNDPFLGLHRPMQPVGPVAIRHDAPSELVDDLDPPVPDEIVDVTVEQHRGVQRLVEPRQQPAVARLGQIAATQLALHV